MPVPMRERPTIMGIHDFYKTGGDTLCYSCDKRWEDVLGLWPPPRRTQADSKQVIPPPQVIDDKIYIANGADLPFSYDGTNVANVTPHSDWASLGSRATDHPWLWKPAKVMGRGVQKRLCVLQ